MLRSCQRASQTFQAGWFFMRNPFQPSTVETDTGLHVDKDVILFKDYFHMNSGEEEMSPVLFPRGFTRDYLDGKVDHAQMLEKIRKAFNHLKDMNDITVVEGTGHCGVGIDGRSQQRPGCSYAEHARDPRGIGRFRLLV